MPWGIGLKDYSHGMKQLRIDQIVLWGRILFAEITSFCRTAKDYTDQMINVWHPVMYYQVILMRKDDCVR